MDRESYFLNLLRKSGITGALDDDCAQLSLLLCATQRTHTTKGGFIIAADSFVENIHFRTAHFSQPPMHKHQWLSYENIAKKAFLVNISDIISSGGLPQYAMLAITLPKSLQPKHIESIVSGIQQICAQYRITLIGGDTMCGRELGFHITMIGRLMGRYLHRHSLRCGDLLAYTSARQGDLGGSLKTLKTLLRYGANSTTLPQSCIESRNRHSRFMLPHLRMEFVRRAWRLIHSCMDISDGLANEIERLQNHSRLTLIPTANIPKQIYQSGEEYELLFCFPPQRLQALRTIAHATRTQIHIVGRFGRARPHAMRPIRWH